jgi:hypothetical protein
MAKNNKETKMKPLVIVRYPKDITEPEIEILREEMKKAINACQDDVVGLALIREDIEIGVLDLDVNNEYDDDDDDDDDDEYM